MSLDSARMPSLADKLRNQTEIEVSSESVQQVEEIKVEVKKNKGRRLNK